MWIWILLTVLIVLVLALAGAAWYFFKFSMGRAEKERSEEEAVEDGTVWHPFQTAMAWGQQWLGGHTEAHVTIRSFDGLKLSALYVPAGTEKPKGTLIVFHGYHSLATVDFAPEVEFLHSLGYRLLVPYQRSHGESEGKYITYGIKERFDARDWARYAESRFPGEDIFLMGISMGSTTVLMSAGTGLPETVRGIVGDCGFTTPWEIMAHVARRDYHLPAFPLLSSVDLLARRFAGCSLKEADTRKILAETKLPVLFLHGEADDFVPLSMTLENYRAYGSVSGSREKALYTVPGAGHAQSYVTDPRGCQEAIRAFFEKYCEI